MYRKKIENKWKKKNNGEEKILHIQMFGIDLTLEENYFKNKITYKLVTTKNVE